MTLPISSKISETSDHCSPHWKNAYWNTLEYKEKLRRWIMTFPTLRNHIASELSKVFPGVLFEQNDNSVFHDEKTSVAWILMMIPDHHRKDFDKNLPNSLEALIEKEKIDLNADPVNSDPILSDQNDSSRTSNEETSKTTDENSQDKPNSVTYSLKEVSIRPNDIVEDTFPNGLNLKKQYLILLNDRTFLTGTLCRKRKYEDQKTNDGISLISHTPNGDVLVETWEKIWEITSSFEINEAQKIPDTLKDIAEEAETCFKNMSFQDANWDKAKKNLMLYQNSVTAQEALYHGRNLVWFICHALEEMEYRGWTTDGYWKNLKHLVEKFGNENRDNQWVLEDSKVFKSTSQNSEKNLADFVSEFPKD